MRTHRVEWALVALIVLTWVAVGIVLQDWNTVPPCWVPEDMP